MKNELGIEVCCENCTYTYPANYRLCDDCLGRDLADFCPSYLALQARIKELQENNFTEEELNILKDIIQDYFRVYTTQHYRTQPLLNKVEQILKTQNKD